MTQCEMLRARRRTATLSDGDVPEAILTGARELRVKGSPSTATQGLRELVLALQGGVREEQCEIPCVTYSSAVFPV